MEWKFDEITWKMRKRPGLETDLQPMKYLVFITFMHPPRMSHRKVAIYASFFWFHTKSVNYYIFIIYKKPTKLEP